MVNLDEFERQMRLELIDDQSRAAVAGVHDDLQGLQLRHVDVGQQVLDIGVGGIDAMTHAHALRAFKLAALGKGANLAQAHCRR